MYIHIYLYTFNLIWYFFVYEHCWQKRRGKAAWMKEGRERMKERRKERWNLALWVELNIPKRISSALVHTIHHLWTWWSKTIILLYIILQYAHPKRMRASPFADCWGLWTHENLGEYLWSEWADMQIPASLLTKLISHPSEPQGMTSKPLYCIFTTHHWTRDPAHQLGSPIICHSFPISIYWDMLYTGMYVYII